MVEAPRVECAGAANNAMHFVAFGQQEFGQVGAILSGDAGDPGFSQVIAHMDRSLSHASPITETPRRADAGKEQILPWRVGGSGGAVGGLALATSAHDRYAVVR
jgi:hypothetical protein